MKTANILVTGCGGDIGLGIGKILRSDKRFKKIIGCDINEDHPGKLFFDKCYLICGAYRESYFSELMNIVSTEQIDLVIPASEPELRVLLDKKLFGRDELFLTANLKAMEIGFDKKRTADFLKGNNLPFPWTMDGFESPKEIPCILKARNSSGSKRIYKVNEDNFEYMKSVIMPDDIWQKYISDDNGEFTCGVYRNEGRTRTIIMKRKLAGGHTGSGEVIFDQDIDDLLHKVAELLDLSGSINIQLRLEDQIPYIFEINPRFSSTLVFRHKLGFKDVLWSIEDKIGLDSSDYILPENHTKFYRISDEFFLKGAEM